MDNPVLKLRKRKLAAGLPFMINSPQLPSRQAYMEYPNGEIHLVSLNQENKLQLERVLTLNEADAIRKEYGLEF